MLNDKLSKTGFDQAVVSNEVKRIIFTFRVNLDNLMEREDCLQRIVNFGYVSFYVMLCCVLDITTLS